MITEGSLVQIQPVLQMEKEAICKRHGKTIFVLRKGKYDSWRCRKCDYESEKRHRRTLKIKLVEHFGGKCIKCGYNKSLRALSFHHRDPKNKLLGISTNIALNKLIEEAKKCDLLCANCHMELEEKGSRIVGPRDVKKQRILVKCRVCGKEIKVRAGRAEKPVACSYACAAIVRKKVTWPGDKELKILLWKIPAVQVAKQLGVASSTIKKHCKSRNIETPPRGYWQKLKTSKALKPD